MSNILIIGAGIAGLACARRLADVGLKPLILDKGRGIGGRLSTRRAGALRFDHGAQYISAKSPEFQQLMEKLSHEGAVGIWQDGLSDTSARPHYVGTPGMSSLPRALAKDLDVRQGLEVSTVRRAETGWVVEAGNEHFQADRVVITIPAPQIPSLLGSDHALLPQVAQARYASCITLMAAFPADAPRPFISRLDQEDALAWIARDNSKPERPAEATTWIAQTSPTLSERWIDQDNDSLAKRLLPMLCERIGASADSALHASAHRWLYARVVEAVGTEFLCSDDHSLYLGGDWCLDARVEAAWQSGDAIGRAISDSLAGRGAAAKPPAPGH